MTTKDELARYLDEKGITADDGLLMADGFEGAFIGVADRFGAEGPERFLVYDAAKCLILLEASGMTADEAREYLEFNVLGAYMGPGTPAFVFT